MRSPIRPAAAGGWTVPPDRYAAPLIMDAIPDYRMRDDKKARI